MYYVLVKTSGLELYEIYRNIINIAINHLLYITSNCNVVHLTTILLIITVMIATLNSIVLDTTISIKQVVEAQNATNTLEPAGDASQILDKITSIIANRIPYQ